MTSNGYEWPLIGKETLKEHGIYYTSFVIVFSGLIILTWCWDDFGYNHGIGSPKSCDKRGPFDYGVVLRDSTHF